MNTPKGLSEKGVHNLTALGRVTDHIREYELVQATWVEACRLEGASWRMIGVSLGVTAQAAFQRFRVQDKAAWSQDPLPEGVVDDDEPEGPDTASHA